MLGDLISAGVKLFAGHQAQQSAERENAATRALQLQMHEQNRQDQITFAKEGLTWKIDDALKNASKVHPIYSLGSAGASFSPVSTNFTPNLDKSMPEAMASAGQDIGRAVNATATNAQRGNAFTNAAQKLQLEGLSLDNDLKRTEVASKVGRLRQNPTPPFPSSTDNWLIPGQAQSPGVNPKALDTAPGHPNASNLEQGAITDAGLARTKDGWAPVPSKDVKERIEDNMPQEWMHFYRNNILPSLGQNLSPPPYKAPDGQAWWFNTLRQEYQLHPIGKRPTMGHRLK